MPEKPSYEELERRIQKLERSLFQHKQAEEALLEDLERYRSLFEGVPIGLYRTDMDGQIVEANAALVNMLGFPDLESLKETKTSELIANSEEQKEERRILENEGAAYGFELELYRMDGKTIWVRDSARAIQGSDGRFLYEGALEDITERKQAEQTIREQHYLLDMITATSPVAITLVDVQGRITFANPAAEATLALRKDDITARTYNDPEWRICGHHGEPFPEEELPFNVVRRTGRPIHDVEHAIEHPDGHRILLSINAAPLKDASGEFVGMVSALTDITERKQAEAALRERNKELHCLQRVRNSLDEGLSEEALFQGVLEALKEGMQYPDKAVPVIILGDKRYSLDAQADNLKTGLHVDIRVEGEPVGRLSVYYESEEEVLLPEEQDLVDAVSKILAHHLERSHAQKELRDREERLKLALHGADLGAWDWEVPSGNFVVNARWAEIMGLDLEKTEPNFRTWEERIHPGDKQNVWHILNDHLEGKRPLYEAEYRVLHESGEWVWVLDKGRVLGRNELGMPVRVCGTLLDISGRKQVEEELRYRLRQEKTLALCSKELVSGDDKAVLRVLERLRSATDVGRVYIFENFESEGAGLCMRQTHEVVADGVKPEIDNPILQALPYVSGGFERWSEQLSMGEHIAGSVDSLPQSECEILESQDILSILVLPIEVRGQWWGFIGFDELETKRIWSDEEIRLLRVAGELIGRHFERRQAEEAMARLASFPEQNPDPVIELNHEGRITYLNPAATTRFPELRAEPTTPHPILTGLSLKTVPFQGAEHPTLTREVQYAGSTFEEKIAYFPKAQLIRVFARDITERKKAEEDLRKSEEKYRLLAETTRDIIVLHDMQGRILYINEAGLSFTGFRESDLIGKSVLDFVPSSEQTDITERRAKRLTGNQAHFLYETKFVNPHGQTVPIEINSSPVIRDGETQGMLLVARDITDRKTLEAQLQQAQKMEAIGTLAGGIAHDFNNILSIILGNVEMVMHDLQESSFAQESLNEVRDASLRARDLVTQILLFARQQEQNVSDINMGPIAKECLKMLRASIPTTVEIQQEIEENLPPVHADPSQIQQVIMNLCTNAGQVMEAEGGTLEFVLDAFELDAPLETLTGAIPEGHYIRLQVRDSGPGIDPENMKRIFEPFFTTKSVGEGTGLGLAVVHGIVAERNGGISVESEKGEGTTFRVYLPASGEERTKETPEEKPANPKGSERILFVDDEPMIMKLGQRILEKQGYEVETRASGTDALECFRQNPERFDLVVTDMSMPGLRGDKLAEEMLKIKPDIPVVLSTGFSKQISEEEANAIGIRAFLMKPLTTEELCKTIRIVLNERASGLDRGRRRRAWNPKGTPYTSNY